MTPRSASTRCLRAQRAVAALTLAAMLAAAPACAQRAPTPAAAPQPAGDPLPPPQLVVLLTVDQLVPEYLERFGPQFTGGLARLLRQGAWFTNASHDHATTETAPGHATAWSGRWPAHTGIVRNEIGVADPQLPLLFGRGGGASPWRFRGSSFFDWVRAKDQWSRALSVSRKDRGAILPLGRARQQAYWYSQDGRFTTSRYYGDTVPTWVRQFNARNMLAQYRGKAWTLLLDSTKYAEPDSIAVENLGRDVTFPHRLSDDERRAGVDLQEFPWMDDETVAFALAGVEALELGKGPGTDVLAVSLSTTDAIGHAFGPQSREVHDQVLRVDRALGRLIDSLYRLRDSTRITVALTADHGVAPFPELHFPGTDPNRGRTSLRPVLDAARSALSARGVEGDALTQEAGIVILDRPRLAARGVDADSVVRALRTAFRQLPGVLRVDLVGELPALADKGDVIARRWLHSIPDDLGAELTVTLEPYYYYGSGRQATHGTPHDYDARVPILLMGPHVRPGRYGQEVFTVDIAPTLAAIVGVPPYEPVDGRVLREAIARPTGLGAIPKPR
jgi:predicted AlkP superfamily pyrophosphatase or phosphodiesterase